MGIGVKCYLGDERAAALAKEKGITRTQAGIRKMCIRDSLRIAQFLQVLIEPTVVFGNGHFIIINPVSYTHLRCYPCAGSGSGAS